MTEVNWNYPETNTPVEGQSIMVEYKGVFWVGTYIGDIVKLSPDYLGWIYLSDCRRWTSWPLEKVSSR